jgi:hypothetical protein
MLINHSPASSNSAGGGRGMGGGGGANECRFVKKIEADREIDTYVY